MRADPVVQVWNELETVSSAFDAACAGHNVSAAIALGQRLPLLTRALHRSTPTSSTGAAILLREALGALQESADAAALVRTVNPIAMRLAGGKARKADLIALRAAQSIARSARHCSEELCSIPDLIGRALRGAAMPVVVSGADDPAPTPRAKSRAMLRLVQ